jgi:hypothetical protein
MPRLVITAAIFLALSAWAGAQGPAAPALTANDRLQLLRKDQVLIANLVDCGVGLGGEDHPVRRAELCQQTVHAMRNAFQTAAEDQDADRVAEFGAHLERLVRDGLVPILDEGKRTIPPNSQDAARLKVIQTDAALDLKGARDAVPPTGKVGENPVVREVCGKLDGLREKLKPGKDE